MKKLFILFLPFYSFQIVAQDLHIPDTVFLQTLIDFGYDQNSDGIIQEIEAEAINTLNLDGYAIKSFTGIGEMLELKTLIITNNPVVENIYLNGNSSNKIKNIIIRSNPLLTNIYLSTLHDLTKITVADLPKLEELTFRKFNNIEQYILLNLPMITKVVIEGVALIPESLNSFQSIEECIIRDCNSISTFQLSSLSNLRSIQIQINNALTEISLFDLPALENLEVLRNPSLIQLSIENLNLTDLSIQDNNDLMDLSLTNLSSLVNLEIIGNSSLPFVQIKDFPMLKRLWITYCDDLVVADIRRVPNLIELYLNRNKAEIYNLSLIPSLDLLRIKQNYSLRQINLSNGFKDKNVIINSNPNLEFVCIDDDDILNFPYLEEEEIPIVYGCDFFNSSEYSVVEGGAVYDEEGDCDDDSYPVPLGSVNLVGEENSQVWSNVTENSFRALIQPGNYTILSYYSELLQFEIEPEVFEVFIDVDDTIYLDPFCLRPSGDLFIDVEIEVIPLNDPRPGFTADYRIKVHSLSNVPASGRFEINYQSDVMTFKESSVEVTVSNDIVSGVFEDILPLQTLEFDISFQLNSPMDEPPLNDGDTICVSFIALSDGIDENRTNNFKLYKQEVLNSYDPNDKTCLQGDYIEYDFERTYIDYRIRFENEGSASAINVKIRDSIDTEAFHIESAKLVGASHDVIMRIDENIIECVFQEINLPFDNESNDGFVQFKILTKADLEKGTFLENEADIYFDFNFPIRTNTSIAKLVTDVDEDGFYSHVDCNDEDANVNPLSLEIPYNGVDDDCNELTLDDDLDGDGFLFDEDCNDQNIEINPAAEEIPNNGIDEDCDGEDLITSSLLISGKSFQYHPNPVTDQLFVKTDLEKIYLEFIDFSGKRIKKVHGNINSIDCSDLMVGSYVVKIFDVLTGESTALVIVKE